MKTRRTCALTAPRPALVLFLLPMVLAVKARVARARGLAPGRLQALIAQHTEGRLLGVLGEPRVNVPELNLALDALK